MGSVAAALEELYGVPPSEFTKRRDALARELKSEGDTAGAATVQGRRKPTQTAYVLNQLSRRYPDEVADLVDAGRELAREQRKALRGEGSGDAFRKSIERQRKVVRDLVQTAGALMKELGIGGSQLDDIAMALQAALVDPNVGAELESGQLEKAPEPATGFSQAESMPALPKKPAASSPDTRGLGRRRPQPTARSRGASPARDRAAARAAAAKEAKQAKAARATAAKEAKQERARRAEARTLLRRAESESKKRQAAAKRAELAAERAIEHAKKLHDLAMASEKRVLEARESLTSLESP